jgi:hypothetical protein
MKSQANVTKCTAVNEYRLDFVGIHIQSRDWLDRWSHNTD